MPPCFTCGQDITFNKKYLSKTGKQIPLWPDEQNTHGHDDQGNPIRGPLPETQAQHRSVPAVTDGRYQTTPQSTQGGGSLDSKRTLQALMELMNEVREIKAILNSRTVLDTQKYEGRTDQMFQVWKPFFNTQGKAASEILNEKGEGEKKVYGWNSVIPTPAHLDPENEEEGQENKKKEDEYSY